MVELACCDRAPYPPTCATASSLHGPDVLLEWKNTGSVSQEYRGGCTAATRAAAAAVAAVAAAAAAVAVASTTPTTTAARVVRTAVTLARAGENDMLAGCAHVALLRARSPVHAAFMACASFALLAPCLVELLL